MTYYIAFIVLILLTNFFIIKYLIKKFSNRYALLVKEVETELSNFNTIKSQQNEFVHNQKLNISLTNELMTENEKLVSQNKKLNEKIEKIEIQRDDLINLTNILNNQKILIENQLEKAMKQNAELIELLNEMKK